VTVERRILLKRDCADTTMVNLKNLSTAQKVGLGLGVLAGGALLYSLVASSGSDDGDGEMEIAQTSVPSTDDQSATVGAAPAPDTGSVSISGVAEPAASTVAAASSSFSTAAAAAAAPAAPVVALADTAPVVAKFDDATIIIDGSRFALSPAPGGSTPAIADGTVSFTGNSGLRLYATDAPELVALASDLRSGYTVNMWVARSKYDDTWAVMFGFGSNNDNRQLGAITWGQGGMFYVHNMWFNVDYGAESSTLAELNADVLRPHMYTFTYDGNTRSIYFDGVLIGTQQAPGSPAFDGEALWIGRNGNATTNAAITMKHYDFRMWRRALSTADVAALYETGVL
jgi:hypothetical protein